MKVKLEKSIAPSDESELLIAIVTSDEGWLFSFAVKVNEPPLSVVLSPGELIVIPAASSSVLLHLVLKSRLDRFSW